MWHAASKQWVMTLAVADHIEFYASKNLKDWAQVGEFGKTVAHTAAFGNVPTFSR
jgi:fructan beta-fructosidase